jgi:hypothetical protein
MMTMPVTRLTSDDDGCEDGLESEVRLHRKSSNEIPWNRSVDVRMNVYDVGFFTHTQLTPDIINPF